LCWYCVAQVPKLLNKINEDVEHPHFFCFKD
jgi:hypothetical protein